MFRQYTIYLTVNTSDKRVFTKRDVMECVDQYFTGYTVLSGLGVWKGDYDETVVLIILHNRHDDIMDMVGELKQKFGQEVILVTWQEYNVKFA